MDGRSAEALQEQGAALSGLVVAIHALTSRLNASMSEPRQEMCILEQWRRRQNRVMTLFSTDGGAIHIQSNVIVRNANLHVFADVRSTIGEGNLVVGLNHDFAMAKHGFRCRVE